MDLGKLQVDDARAGSGYEGGARRRSRDRPHSSRCCGFTHTDWQQTYAVSSVLAQSALAILASPVMNHVGVDSMLPGHSSHRGSRLHRQFYNPALLRYAAPLPLGLPNLPYRGTLHHHLPQEGGQEIVPYADCRAYTDRLTALFTHQ